MTLYAAKVVGRLGADGSDAVSVVPVDVGSVRSGPDGDASRILAARRFFESVDAALGAHRPSWIHERLSLFAGAGTELATRHGLARVVEVNAPVADERIDHFALHLVEEAYRAERAALAGARVAAVSGPMASWALSRGASESTVIPNGADTTRLAPGRWTRSRGIVRRDLGFPPDLPVVGFVGSLKPWHGVERMIDAVASASHRGRLGLLVVGDGPQRERVLEAVATLPPLVHPVFVGAVPSASVPPYVAAMDIAVAPYLQSGSFYFSPLKVAEAMAAGLPVIASDFPPVREMLGDTGVLVDPGDDSALAQAISGLAGDPSERRRLGLAGRARAVRRLDWRSVAQRTIALGLDAEHVTSGVG